MGRALLYLGAVVWAFSESFLKAESGNWLPLILLFALFALAFVILGCWPARDETITRTGSIFLILIAAACLIFAIQGLDGSWLGVAKVIAGLLLAAVAFINFARGPKPAGDSGHH